MNVKYDVLIDVSLNDLIDKMNEHLLSGWEVTGGIHTVEIAGDTLFKHYANSCASGGSYRTENNVYWAQAIIKKEQKGFDIP